MRKIGIVLLSAAICTTAAFAQVGTESTSSIPDGTVESSTSPVAYVYVSAYDSGFGHNGIVGYAADASGRLTPIPGSPFSDDVNFLAGNDNYLFGSSAGESARHIESYKIESNGALSFVHDFNVAAPDGSCGYATEIFLDHTGATLYNVDPGGYFCENGTYEVFSIESTGKLKYLGIDGDYGNYVEPFTLIGNNKFGYTSQDGQGDIIALQRNSNGSLTQLSYAIPFPSASSGSYQARTQAADPANHVAVLMQGFDTGGNPTTDIQLGTYTAASDGNLTTTSTQADMPTVAAVGTFTPGYPPPMNMAPSGKLLAVGGANGLEVFHFNGPSPITHYTGLLTTDGVYEVFWDKANHLYAISYAVNKLWVFTVTPTSFSQAPGSPYTLNDPQGLKVLPLPR
jgi:hypothetical protein